ncbi:MAG: M14 family zinc carboxypeptidase [Candidatus Melainabacteria bacterium]
MPLTTWTTETQVLGRSVEGRDIPWTWYGAAPQPGQPLETLMIGVFHGDEGIAGELLLRLQQALELLAGQNDPALAGIKLPFAILPVFNPDGLARLTRQNANGVDLNRNYPTNNWVKENEGEIYFSGNAAASEPETRIMIEILEKHPPAKIITVHSPYKVINWDGPAEALAQRMSALSGYPAVADIGYPTPGSFGTYVGTERRIPTITLELPEDEPLADVWADNREALLAALAWECPA